jgi:hypothetical protein
MNDMLPQWTFNSKALIDIADNLGYNYFKESGTLE